MKSIAEFKKETSEHTMAIRELCKQELTAMRDDFCKNEFGYHTMIEKNTLIISWIPSWTNHTSYVDEIDSEED